MKLKDICGIQEPSNDMYFVLRDELNSAGFSIWKESMERTHAFDKKKDALKFVIRQIVQNCVQFVISDPTDIVKANHSITTDIDRGPAKILFSDRFGIAAYRGEHDSDAGIIVVKDGGKYIPQFPSGWEKYYRVLVNA